MTRELQMEEQREEKKRELYREGAEMNWER